MIDEGTIGSILWSTLDYSEDVWLKVLKDTYCLTMLHDGRPIGITWFNPGYGLDVSCHFVLYKPYYSVAEQAGHLILGWLNKEIKVRTFYGLMPRPYRHERRLLEAWGFKEVETIPYACYMAKHKRYVDGIFMLKVV